MARKAYTAQGNRDVSWHDMIYAIIWYGMISIFVVILNFVLNSYFCSYSSNSDFFVLVP